MIGHQLREFVDMVMDRKAITAEDLVVLQHDVFADAVMTRDDVDVLVALDRAVPVSTAGFADWLTATVVDLAVWESRPTGVIDREKAHWLTATLTGGEGPSATARRIAFEIVREAQSCDELLVGFAMARDTLHPRGAARAERYALAS